MYSRYFIALKIVLEINEILQSVPLPRKTSLLENLSEFTVYVEKYPWNGSNMFLRHSHDCLPPGLFLRDGISEERVFTLSEEGRLCWLRGYMKTNAMQIAGVSAIVLFRHYTMRLENSTSTAKRVPADDICVGRERERKRERERERESRFRRLRVSHGCEMMHRGPVR